MVEETAHDAVVANQIACRELTRVLLEGVHSHRSDRSDKNVCCVCIEGRPGGGKTTCLDEAVRAVQNQIESVSVSASASATTGCVRVRTHLWDNSEADYKAPTIGVDAYMGRVPVVLVADNVHAMLKNDRSMFAALLRTIDAVRASNHKVNNPVVVAVTLSETHLDARLVDELYRRASVVVRVCRPMSMSMPRDIDRDTDKRLQVSRYDDDDSNDDDDDSNDNVAWTHPLVCAPHGMDMRFCLFGEREEEKEGMFRSVNSAAVVSTVLACNYVGRGTAGELCVADAVHASARRLCRDIVHSNYTLKEKK